MVSGTRYRVVSAAGAVVATAGAVLVANTRLVQAAVTTLVPLVSRLNPTVLAGDALLIALVTTVVAVALAVAPLFKPQPRRILNVVAHTQRRVLIAGLGLATIGYFDYSYRLPRTTLLVTVGVLLVVLPVWFVAIRRRPDGDDERVIVVGDDPGEIERVVAALDREPLGYVAPSTYRNGGVAQPDGGVGVEREGVGVDIEYLGGLSRLEDVLVEEDVDTALFAFAATDRQEFFGALGACHDHGVAAKVHRDRADSVLVADEPGEELVDVDVEPWDWQDRVVKRVFDVAFAACGLVVLSPVMAGIAVAIKIEDGGTLLYSQERTAELGETFTVYKFRSMVENAEDGTGAKLSEEDKGGVDPRVTRVGRVLRRTHLDEIPQLWSILVGDMSVVGPRPERPELEGDMEGLFKWRQRWFVKPGLTGLAQINDVTGHEPRKKLRYDVEYIRRQSFRYDVAIVIRQVWKVLGDVVATVRNGRTR